MRPRISLAIIDHAATPEVNADDSDYDQNCEPDAGVEPVVVDRVGRSAAGVVGDDPEGRRPDDASGRIPEEEAPPVHVADPGEPRRRHPQDRDEAAEEDGFRSVALEEALGGWEDASEVVAEVRNAPQQRPAALAADPVARVVADDRSGRGDDDHGDDR